MDKLDTEQIFPPTFDIVKMCPVLRVGSERFPVQKCRFWKNKYTVSVPKKEQKKTMCKAKKKMEKQKIKMNKMIMEVHQIKTTKSASPFEMN